MKECDFLRESKHTLAPPAYFQGVTIPNPPGSTPLAVDVATTTTTTTTATTTTTTTTYGFCLTGQVTEEWYVCLLLRWSMQTTTDELCVSASSRASVQLSSDALPSATIHQCSTRYGRPGNAIFRSDQIGRAHV